MNKIWLLKVSCDNLVHEGLLFKFCFLNFLLYYTFLFDVDAFVSLECVYEAKHSALIGTVTCKLLQEKASLGPVLL